MTKMHRQQVCNLNLRKSFSLFPVREGRAAGCRRAWPRMMARRRRRLPDAGLLETLPMSGWSCWTGQQWSWMSMWVRHLLQKMIFKLSMISQYRNSYHFRNSLAVKIWKWFDLKIFVYNKSFWKLYFKN